MHTLSLNTRTHLRPDLRVVIDKTRTTSVNLLGFSRRELRRLVAEMID